MMNNPLIIFGITMLLFACAVTVLAVGAAVSCKILDQDEHQGDQNV